jgi:succinylarginine dihydrolase
VKAVHYVDLRQSMHNGGGPACLRLRVVLTAEQMATVIPGVMFSGALHARLLACIERHYRETLSASDLLSHPLAAECAVTLHQILDALALRL